MAKFAVGQAVRVGFNPPRPDLRVADQVNGKAPDRGEYQTVPNPGVVIEVHEREAGVSYLVDVELSITHDRGGKPYVVKSMRKRIVDEAKLEAA